MKKPISAVLVFLCASLLLNCSVSVRHEYDKKTDFSRYSTYTWINDKGIDRSLDIAGSIESAIKEQLTAKGFKHESASEAELGVGYYGGVKGRVDVIDYNFSAWGDDYGIADPDSPVFREGTLVIEVVDMRTRMIVWRGWADVFIKDSQGVEEVIDGVVAKILEKFPPQ